ncbi:unnamed protein product [Didymodactylos carnosus]|uniref:Uncharacterized protein n=1 Tax=Didymodactylos carnosus TaxID=1234261 RepID=A0A814J7K3_9BILA|nr:unnamed protein product [Didymodactylos carnosus]CAF1034430.1 unnamed protein product [Didymodactylos carnosus]CAF3620875.1 unnamed protein product [Didymodactylos carnosus]CAF3805076.1 unnamed protein product [Didymodactylos carnosus]
MLSDALKALLGAISKDRSADHRHEKLFAVIKLLWSPYLVGTEIKILAATAVNTPSPPSPNYQSVFTGLGDNISVVQFRKFLTKVDDVNRRNVGEKGNTSLMILVAKGKLRNDVELPKIEVLLECGAKWTATNNYDETADEFAAKNHGGQEAVLQMVQMLKSKY